jgi:hypothetical protein
MPPLSEGTQSDTEFRAIVWPVLDGLWKSYGSATKDFTSGEKLTCIDAMQLISQLQNGLRRIVKPHHISDWRT